jgi:acetamidase/formamidase
VATFCVLIVSTELASAGADITDPVGRWEVTTSYPGGSFVAGLELQNEGGRFSGRSGYLVPDGMFYRYAGDFQAGKLHLDVLAPDGKTQIGNLYITVKGGSLVGKGTLHDLAISISGHRPLSPPKAARVIDFVPKVYYRTFSGANSPALHIFPGDTVRTSTVDANGGGPTGPLSMGGNPQTGPIYIEGAMIGDTIAVHFNKIRPNRDTAFQYRSALGAKILPPGYPQEPTENWSDIWRIDRSRGTATPVDPSEKLKHFEVKITPMLGCVGVAPYWNQAIGTSEAGPFGGNMDNNEIREGTTLYLPVYQAGALLTVGDGHAVQGDGEITGQGLETSMDVEFTVQLIRNQLLDQPWAENDEYIMVSGIAGSLDSATQIATAGLSNWLKAYYRLSDSEIATVLATSVHYDIAVVVDPEVGVVAKIRKDALAQIPKPGGPTNLFCQPSWGCLRE